MSSNEDTRWFPAHYTPNVMSGWVCPLCGKSNSPLALSCFICAEIAEDKRKQKQEETIEDTSRKE